MPLSRVPLDDLPAVALPAPAAALVAEAEARIERWARGDCGRTAFVPADYRRVFAALRAIEVAGLAPDLCLCEWGSGFGVVAMLAAQLGFDACGIEVEADLVAEAERLSGDMELPVTFACGNFIPRRVEHLAMVHDDLATLAIGGGDGHEALGLDPDDFGVIYAYPWPGEEAVVEAVFEAVAARGALLLTYRSTEDLVLQRKR